MKIKREIGTLMDELWTSIKRNIRNSNDVYVTLDYDEKTKTTLIKVSITDEE